MLDFAERIPILHVQPSLARKPENKSSNHCIYVYHCRSLFNIVYTIVLPHLGFRGPVDASRLSRKVNGDLSLSRALGDLEYKDEKLPPEHHIVIRRD